MSNHQVAATAADLPDDPAAAAEARFARAQYQEFIGRETRWAVYPQGWPDKWGRPPMLGTVVADSEHTALYRAYDKGIANPSNCSFGYRFKNLGPARKTLQPN